MTQEKRLNFLINFLLGEKKEYRKLKVPDTISEKKMFLRGLMNIREPKEIDEKVLKIQDEYLQNEIKEKGITDSKALIPIQENLYLWQGDITTLKCDAIVNAANSQMLGCFYPLHNCIDNVIHTYAGMQLRLKCAELMKEQKQEEKTGGAKITPAFNLPSKYIIHTVGPIIYKELQEKQEKELAGCYNSCLEKAREYNLSSIAFCCISTGEFHFPNEKAAEIAVKSAKSFLKKDKSKMKVIFNVFKDKDYKIYRELLGKD